jgi:hypothetical protein
MALRITLILLLHPIHAKDVIDELLVSLNKRSLSWSDELDVQSGMIINCRSG